MNVEMLFARLDGVRSRGAGKFIARCPAHQDKSPSLSIREGIDRILLHCFAGCQPESIVAALGLEMRDLFTDTPTSHGQRSTPRPQRLDLVAVAFRFELAALDRRLRADTVLMAVANFTIEALSEEQLDRLMNAVASAYQDRERAEFLEVVAHDFRTKAFHERMERHAA